MVAHVAEGLRPEAQTQRRLALARALRAPRRQRRDPDRSDIRGAGQCGGLPIRAVNVAEEIGIIRKARHSDGRVSNVFELLLPVANGRKFEVPTVATLTDAEGSNGRTAATVLSVERKEVVVRVPSITTTTLRGEAARTARMDRVVVTETEIFDPERFPECPRLGTIEAAKTQTGVGLTPTEELDQNPIDSLVSTAEKFPTEAPAGPLNLPGVRAVLCNGAAANTKHASHLRSRRRRACDVAGQRRGRSHAN